MQRLATQSLHDAEVDGMVRLCLNTALSATAVADLHQPYMAGCATWLKQPNLACCSLSSSGPWRRTCVPLPGLPYASAQTPMSASSVAPWPVRCNALLQPAPLTVCDCYYQLTADLMRQTLWEAHRCLRPPGATRYQALQLMSHRRALSSNMSSTGPNLQNSCQAHSDCR